ncbi:MAG: MmcQ/YjbR family DNA-binding protein [Fimbriimonas sp.]
MTFDEICEICRALPAATEDVKWGNDLVFSVGGKMFAALGMNEWSLGFKCTEAQFHALIDRPGVTPAKYLARAHWVSVAENGDLSDAELKDLLAEAHRTVFEKLPNRVQRELQGI